MRLIIDHVNYIYEEGTITETAALHDVSLTIEQGEMIALIGHGGSGKSTLALMMAGLVSPTSGSLLLSNHDRPDASLFHSVGLVFQYPEQQMFGQSVFEEVAFGPRNYGVPEDYLPARVRQALEEVDLPADEFWHRSPFLLSGGQKRRVCIASVIAMNPRVIIFDEPSAGLDEAGKAWLSALIRRLNSEGRTVIWITHNMEEAAEHARRIIVLDHGKVVLDGTPQQVFAEEDVLRRANLTIPYAARLVRELKRRGADLPGQAVTVEHAYREILSWLQRRDAAAQEMEIDKIISSDEMESLRSSLRSESVDAEESLSDDEQWERRTAEELRTLVLNARETAFVGPNPPAEDQIRTDVESPLSSSPQPAQGGKEDV